MLTVRRYTIHQTEANAWMTQYSFRGMDALEHMTVLDYTDDHVLVYYCWSNTYNQFPSVIVYSRQPGVQLTPELEERFQRVIDNAGISHIVPRLADFCQPSYTDECPSNVF
jgi:hypothetical protein